jgi:hypothetical protein
MVPLLKVMRAYSPTAWRNEPSPNSTSFDRHSSFTERTP